MLCTSFTGWPFTDTTSCNTTSDSAEGARLSTEGNTTLSPPPSGPELDATRRGALVLVWSLTALMCAVAVLFLVTLFPRCPACLHSLLSLAYYCSNFLGCLVFLVIVLCLLGLVSFSCFSGFGVILGIFLFTFAGIAFFYRPMGLFFMRDTLEDLIMPQDSRVYSWVCRKNFYERV
ncbi:hypothetical protein ACOMHN_015259 [Nucella lapillus]